MNNENKCCYNCGGSFQEENGRMVCLYCGTVMPRKITDEEASLLYSAFQKLRLADFEASEQEFDDVISRHPGCAQAYWGRMMSRYGIKYESDYDGKRVPTCYAELMESVTESSDYHKALEYADEETAAVFKEHAAYMDRVCLEWKEKAGKEKPYDIFISYKDSDSENGLAHTSDSDELRELYLFLMKKGYRVFFSRESLLEKTGEKYEPYIYGAIASAKIMLVYGSKPEYIVSTWVKNEWTRYMKRIASGEKHPESLLVAYKGFSPKELPSALCAAGRQHIDAGKPEFYNEILEAINRLTDIYEKKGVNFGKSVTCQHEEVIIPAKAPTCTQAGWTESSHCALCGDILKPIEVIPATGHSFGEWKIVKPATCVENGEYERVCHCGKKETKPIVAFGAHVASDEWVTVREARVGKEGLRVRKCIVCGSHVEEMKLPALPEYDAAPTEKPDFRTNPKNSTCEITGPGKCRGLVVIPSEIDGYRVTEIAENAFRKCKSVKGVVISDSVTRIGKHAFSECENLESVMIGGAVTEIGESAFYHCHALKSAVFGESVERIGSNAFYECESLINLVLPASLTTVGAYAFGYCKSLSGAVIGESVVSIGASAFRGCTSLSRVNIPVSVQSIGLGAFSDGVTEFQVSGGNPAYTAVGGNLLSKDETTFIQYATGKMDKFFSFPHSVKTIGDQAFRGCGKIVTVSIPESVTAIGAGAFKNCGKLNAISYGGKKKQWKKLSLGEDWNADPAVETILCADGALKLKK